MKFFLNGKPKEIPASINLSELVKNLELKNASIAIAKNNEVIPKSQWSEIFVDDDDAIEIVHPTQGG